jgi:23S rRNA pseudouridine2605 synthase
METRIQKILAQAGYGSRRSCEKLILDDRVMVNGIPASLGMKANLDHDLITVDGKSIKSSEPLRYIMLHKPRGVLSTTKSPDPRPTVRSIVHTPGRLFPVGRLDANSEGLILLTNDGELTNRLTHPRYEHEKEYLVMVKQNPSDTQLNAWRKGIILDDGTLTLPANVKIDSKDPDGTWLRVILKEGKNRQIRRMGDASGLLVKRLIRLRMANLTLGELTPGEWRDLTEDEITQLIEIKE